MKPFPPVTLFLALIFAAACARADTFYVSYIATNTIEEFAPDGTDLGPFPASGLNSPQGIAFDAQGNLYVTNSNSTIGRFSPTGTDLGPFVKTGLSNPIDLVFDSAGNLYVSSFSSNSIRKFSPTGTDLGTFANTGFGPWGLAFDSGGNLCVSAQSGNTVHKFSPAGVDLGSFASGNVSTPLGLAFDLSGNLYVSNLVTNTVQIYSPTGTNLGQVAVSGLNQPTGLFFDSGGNLYISDSSNNEIRKVSPAGTYLGVFATTGTGRPVFMTVRSGPVGPKITSQSGNLTLHSGNTATFSATATGTGLAYQWQKNGVNLSDGGNITGSTTASLQISPATSKDSAVYRVIVSNAGGAVASSPVSLAVLAPSPPPPGTFFVSYISANSIEEFSPNGTDLGAFVMGLNSPQGIAFDAQGNLYVTNSNNTIGRFSPTGADLGPFATTGLNNPIDLVFDTAGNLYVSNYGSNTIRKFSPSGADLGTFANPGSGPWGLTFDSGGNLCVSAQTGNTVHKFSPAGVDLGSFAAGNVNTPLGLAFDLSGNLYVSNLGTNTVQIYSPTGTNLGHVAVTGLNQPTGLFFDSNGNLYISDSSNNEIRKVSPSGADLGVFATTGGGRPVFMTALPLPAAASISIQPTPLTVAVGAAANFTVAATGYPIPTYQWQISTDGGNTWGNLTDGGNITGSATFTLSLSNTTAMMTGDQFRAVASNSVAPATSNAATLTVDIAPNITVQPGNQTVIAGNTTTFTASASGNPAPAFQWQISTDGGNTWSNLTNGGNISGATSATLSLGNTTAVMLGNQFRAVATNAVGASTTSAATLTVNIAPGITTQPGNQTVIAGNATTFTAAASGNPAPAFQWQISTDGGDTWSNLTDGANITGSANTTLSLANITAIMLGNQFRAVATNTLGSATSDAATLTVNTVPIITVQPGDQTVIAGNTTTFTAAASGYPAPAFQWQISTDGGDTWTNLANNATVSGSATATLSLSKITAAMLDYQYRAIATNAAGMATTNAANLTVLFPPQITSQPIGMAVFSLATATFSVNATGNPAPGYQWYLNGKFIPSNATSATLIVANVTAAKLGNYTVVVANGIGNPVTSDIARLTLGVAPRITTQPGNQTVPLGQNAVFNVAATGNPTPAYQWQISTVGGTHWSNLTDNTTISGAASPTLTVSNTTAPQSGFEYRVIASNLIGLATHGNISVPATLTIYFTPAITALAAGNISSLSGGSQNVPAGGNLTFSVTATGTALSYQWQLNGKNIRGATASNYTLTNATAAAAGAYRVVVSNALNSVTSNNFVLTVLIQPMITTQPKAQTVKTGKPATFTVVASTRSTTPLSYQWKFNGAPLTDGPNITGATKASLTLASVTSANAGSYQVVLSNVAGNLSSSSVKLTVP